MGQWLHINAFGVAVASAHYPNAETPVPVWPPALATLRLPHDQQMLVTDALIHLLGATRTADPGEWLR